MWNTSSMVAGFRPPDLRANSLDYSGPGREGRSILTLLPRCGVDPAGRSGGAESAPSGSGRVLVREAELPLHAVERLPVHLRVGVDEVVDRRALLRRVQHDLPAPAELEPVFVVVAVEVGALLRALGGLAAVDWNPAPVHVELRPA